MQKNYLVSTIALILTLTSVIPALAASPSPLPSTSPSPSPASMGEVTENLKKRLQESLDAEETSALSPLRAYVGTVKDVIKDTIIVEDKDGKKDVKVLTDTTILRSPGNTTIKPENVRIDDSIIAIGSPSADEVLSGKRLIVSTDPIEAPPKESGMGTISKMSKGSLTIKAGDKDHVLLTTTKTILKSSVGSIELEDLEIGDTLIYTATIDDDELTATILMRIKTAALAE